jgi:predicted  nucleic acid-binding Zn-ribbon protein
VDKDEQKDVLEAIKQSREKHQEDYVKNIAAFRDAPEEVKEKVRNGTIDIADISWQKDAIQAPFTPQTSKSQVTKLMKKVMEWKKLTEEINGDMEFLVDNAYITEEQRGKFLLIVKGISVSFLSKLLEWLGSSE